MILSEDAARAYVAGLGDAPSLARLQLFVAKLTQANERQNLVSKGSLEHLWRRHIADSAQLLRHVSRETGTWLDLGSGAGFPGLVIAILRPNTELLLVESRKLRILWLEQMVEELGCTNCRVLSADLRRIETFPAGVISARAFAPMDRLIALSARFSTSRTRWVLPKGRSVAQELADLPIAQREMFHVEQSLTDPEARIVVGTGKPPLPR